MLNEGALLVHELNFLFIGLLPIIFFKREKRLNLLWWATALPFFLCPAYLLAAHFGLQGASPLIPEAWRRGLTLLSVPCAVVSLMLIAYTLGTHRIPISLWHQRNDAPVHIVTWGAYEKIRHPFYTSFLLALFGALIFAPHPVTALTFSTAVVVLNLTAAKEERRLLGSKFGSEYETYMARTGRFLPR